MLQMTWPPQSPNINPVEVVWDGMDCRVKTKGPTTSAQHLRLLVLEELASIAFSLQKI